MIFARYGKQIEHYVKKLLRSEQNDRRSRNLTDFGIYIPRQYQVHGIDISHHQQDIDWEDLSSMNINGISFQFVYIKATEGDSHRDRLFATNWQSAKEYGLIRGAYHFYQPDIKSDFQADHFISTVQLETGDLPPVLDIEITGSYSVENLRKGLKNWLRIVEAHYKIKPIIYTNLNYYRKYLAGHFSEYKFWIAQYERSETNLPDHKWYFWQYSNQGKANGIAGLVDFNAFQGNLEELKAICIP